MQMLLTKWLGAVPEISLSPPPEKALFLSTPPPMQFNFLFTPPPTNIYFNFLRQPMLYHFRSTIHIQYFFIPTYNIFYIQLYFNPQVYFISCFSCYKSTNITYTIKCWVLGQIHLSASTTGSCLIRVNIYYAISSVQFGPITIRFLYHIRSTSYLFQPMNFFV